MADIIYTKTKWEDVSRVTTKIVEAVGNEDEKLVIIACLALAVSAQVRNFDITQVIAGVKGASEYIALWASSVDSNASQVVN